jgi:hypothetical protein
MARKRRVQQSDDLKLPDFDEKSYLQLEMRGSVFLLLCVGLALLMAILAAFLTWGMKDGRIAFVLGILGFFLVRMLMNVLKVDMTGFDKMRWLGGFGSYFLTFLVIWTLLINPPLVDLVPPQITDKTAYNQELGSIITIGANVDDNQGVSSVQVALTDPLGHDAGTLKMNRSVQNRYWAEIPHPMIGKYNYTIEARDQGGFFVSYSNYLQVMPNQAPTIQLYGVATNISVGDPIRVQIKDNVGVILAFWGLDQPPNFSTIPGSKETSLKLENNKDTTVTIPTTKWNSGPHNITVCALDRVPHRETCNSFHFNVF